MSALHNSLFFRYEVDPELYKRNVPKVEEFVPPEDFGKRVIPHSDFKLADAEEEAPQTRKKPILPH